MFSVILDEGSLFSLISKGYVITFDHQVQRCVKGPPQQADLFSPKSSEG